MIYEEHGLTTKIAFNSALKRAGIEITLQEAPLEITTDVICTVDTTEHDEGIQADAIRKFAEWLENKNYLWRIECLYGGQRTSPIFANVAIEEYEKE